MPEYLAPGVYVEETSFRSKTIEGVSTSTAGFIGEARYGPTEGEPELLTSFADFERIYGGLDPLDEGKRVNYLAHGVRAFFSEGGARLYCMRVPGKDAKSASAALKGTATPTGGGGDTTPPTDDGGDAAPPTGGGGDTTPPTDDAEGTATPAESKLEARFVGAAGNLRVTFHPRLSRNTYSIQKVEKKTTISLKGLREFDTVFVEVQEYTPDTPDTSDTSDTSDTQSWRTTKSGVYDASQSDGVWTLKGKDGSSSIKVDTSKHTVENGIAAGAQTWKSDKRLSIRVLTIDVDVERPVIRPRRPSEKFGPRETLEGFSLHPNHPQFIGKHFTQNPKARLLQLTVPFAFVGKLPETGYGMLDLLGATPEDNKPPTSRPFRLEEGQDGTEAAASAFEGKEGLQKTGLKAFEDVEDISILAAPGYATYGDEGNVSTIQAHLINHCEKMRYRIAVLDSPPEQTVSTVRDVRGRIDSTKAAFYYPGVTILDPITQEEANMPPSGFVSGIYARNDVEHGVHKAPANEVVRLAIGFETLLNKAQQDVLNPEGVNCFRFFEGRGYRLWGARTATSDPEWKYVNVRRYFMYLERSIEKGTQWVVFENNSELLWSKVRQTIEDFLYAEFASGHLMGTKPEEAYFVRCDRSTMTQNDLDNGRLICLIGVAPVRPAEFVIFRIGQFTAESRS